MLPRTGCENHIQVSPHLFPQDTFCSSHTWWSQAEKNCSRSCFTYLHRYQLPIRCWAGVRINNLPQGLYWLLMSLGLSSDPFSTHPKAGMENSAPDHSPFPGNYTTGIPNSWQLTPKITMLFTPWLKQGGRICLDSPCLFTHDPFKRSVERE